MVRLLLLGACPSGAYMSLRKMLLWLRISGGGWQDRLWIGLEWPVGLLYVMKM